MKCFIFVKTKLQIAAVCYNLARFLTVGKCKFNFWLFLIWKGNSSCYTTSMTILQHTRSSYFLFPEDSRHCVACLPPSFNALLLINLHPSMPETQESCLSGGSPNHYSGRFSDSYFLDQLIFNYFKTAKAPTLNVLFASNAAAAGWYMLSKDRTSHDLFQYQFPY